MTNLRDIKLNTEPVLHGGDRLLFTWLCDDWEALKNDKELKIKAGYEDRQEWVRVLLTSDSIGEGIQLFLDQFPKVSDVHGVKIGQEEDRSNGKTTRYVAVVYREMGAIAQPKEL